MYLWFSIDVDKYYQDLKEKVEYVKNEIGCIFDTNGLPYHISLKISFEVPIDKEYDIIKDIEDFYKSLKPFTIKTRGIEENNVILWVRYQENEYLTYISKKINEILNVKYGIPYHPYDTDFIFHTTLFMNDDHNIIHKGYKMLKNEKLKDELYINTFIIGYSPAGIPGTYSVLKEIEVN